MKRTGPRPKKQDRNRFNVSLTDMNKKLPPSRPYRMQARAQSAAATGERILDAAVEVYWENNGDELSLDEVARRAGVTVQTVIRRFGGKQGLFTAAVDRETERVRRERGEAPVGDVPGAVQVLLASYETTGERMLAVLAEEHRMPSTAVILDRGRALHREWCARVFAPALASLPATERKRRLAQLVAVCDVYTWKLLRRDAGLSRRQTELAMVELLTPIAQAS
jgi:AcrR family transcriptional regulator